MLLKKIRLKGFKSFADQTEVYFSPGVNVLVGPNGCGKSNIVEAVRWVLGDSIRELRGQRPEDVIFNGSDGNRALGLASVSMVLDNRDAALPLDFNEVNIGRKLFRNGENEYEINRAKVRLKDVNRLFLGTGLGKQGFSIIGQGELEAVLNGHSFSRRLILEEAAGIIKFRQERDEVKKRINASEQDLLRIQDLLLELAQQYELLAEKNLQAETYLQEKNRLDTITAAIWSFEIEESKKQYGDREEKIITLQSNISAQKQETESMKLTCEKTEASIHTALSDISEKKENKHTLDSELRSQEAEQELLQERIRMCAQRIQQVDEAQIKLNQQLNQIQEELNLHRKSNQDRSDQLETEKNAFVQEQEQLKIELEWLTATAYNLQERLLILKTQTEVRQNLSQEKAEIQQAYATANEKRRYLMQSLENQANEELELTRQLAKANEQLQVIETVRNEHEKQAKTLEANYSTLILEQQSQQQALTQLVSDLHRAQSGLHTLRELEANHTLYSDGVKAILKAAEEKNSEIQGVLGTIADLIQIPPGFELALEVVVGRGLENIVIETGKKAREAIYYLESKKMGRATFLPLDTLKVRPMPDAIKTMLLKQPGVKGIAAELLTYGPKLQIAVEYLFGNIVVVEDLNHGLKLFKEIPYPLRIVTLNGALLNSSGAITGGFHRNASSGILTKKAEKQKWEQQVSDLKQRHAIQVDATELLTHQAQKVNESWQQEEKQVLSLEFKKEEVLRQLNELSDKREQIKNQLIQTEGDLSIVDQLLKEQSLHLEQLTEAMLQLEQKKDEEDTWHQEQQGQYEHKRRAFEIKQERLHSLQEQLQMKAAEIEQNQAHIMRYEQIESDYLASLKEAEKNLNTYQLEQTAAYEQLALIQKKSIVQKTLAEALEFDLIELTQGYDENHIRFQEQKNQLDLLRLDLDRMEQSLHTQELQKVRAEMEVEMKLGQWEEWFKVKYVPPVELLSRSMVKEFRGQRLEIEQTLELLGPVDLNAITEFKTLERRYHFLQQQAEDLKDGKQTLEGILQQTEDQMTLSFQEFFILVEKSFKRTFQAIFGGGEANLNLTKNDEPFNAGVDISVKLPGKKLQNLDLLSGGERALTCIAFIFSLLHLKAAPFCFLDEIDAALDESNLLRFNQYVNHLAEHTQFIIISHRQPTIVNGKTIYGITMEQKGISKCVSLNIDEASRLVNQAAGS